MKCLLILLVLTLYVCPAAAFADEVETYETDRAWSFRIENGACTRLRDRRTDAPGDVAECRRDHATQPRCINYQGWAFAWYDVADIDMPPAVDKMAMQMNVINTTATKPDAPSYYQSSQFRDALHRLLKIAISPNRKKFGATSKQFSDYAYKLCMENHLF